MLFDNYSAQELESLLSKLIGFIRQGLHPSQISAELKLQDFDELLSIAKARIKNNKDGKIQTQGLFFTLDDLRFATNEIIAKYRAERLKCDTIVEVGCGIGIQTIAFAQTCKKVYAIDLDKRKLRYAIENAKVAGLSNITFIEGDSLSVVHQIPEANIVFCEPERLPEVKERSLDELKPNIGELIKIYSSLTSDFCIELPPQLRSADIEGEREYVSVNGNLNRLLLYTGNLKKSLVSAVSLPGNHRLELQEGENLSPLPLADEAMKYVFEVDAAIQKAGLASKLGLNIYQLDKYVTSNSLISNPFFKASFEIVWKGLHDPEKIISFLKQFGAGKVVLRAKVDPSKYWQERNRFEKSLLGDKLVHLFVVGEKAFIGLPSQLP